MATKKKVEIQPRGFEVVKSPVVPTFETTLPTRTDIGSAGYDFYAKETKRIPPHRTVLFYTDVKAFMEQDEVLLVHVRSSIGIKRGLVLANCTGVIDSTYYNSEDNDGNIIIALHNLTDQSVYIDAGERIAQGIFTKYLSCGDSPTDTRKGGVGSSGR